MAEFDLIRRIQQRSGDGALLLGIGDDAALIEPPPGQVLAVTSDTLNIGVHFPHDARPADIGWKALAVNLSDLAAMGATPAFCTVALSLPQADRAWLDGFLDGFLELAIRHGVVLAGGDTTRGPLSITVTAHGWVPAGQALRRDGARIGDDVWVTGTLGDATAALAQLEAGGVADAALRARLDRPTPRIEAGLALRALAHACIDLSDGLLQDIGHVCRASGTAAEIALDALPASTAFLDRSTAETRHGEQATGGDDYELCFTAAPASEDAIHALAASLPLRITRVGSIVEGEGVLALLADGTPWQPPRSGYAHFG
ncbi:MAG: thiamine-phosphate kinase [Pseudoxanthomonas suwonensis]|nr:thiamine-phosphate kinase [Pseudoxanthomonas suwonensis]